MPTITQTFQDYEPDMLEMITEQWGIEDDIDPDKHIKKQLSNLVNNKTLFKEVIHSLSPKAQSALKLIQSDGGKTPAAQFMRLFGEIREMGAGARGKERPDRNPKTISENLFYKGLIALSFFNEKNEAKEYIYIPKEFLTFLKSIQDPDTKANTPPAFSEKTLAKIFYTSDEILDHICSLLAALRGKTPSDEVSRVIPFHIQQFLNAFFLSQKIIDKKASIFNMDKLKDLLSAKRDTAFSKIYLSWMEDNSFNELKLLSNLSFEGKWKNDPIKTRKNLLEIISHLHSDTWYSFIDFIGWMEEMHPDFQRSGGEYDLWFIKDMETGVFINGFENWQKVEGRLLEYFLTGPLFWLGIIDLSSDNENVQPIAFKKSKWAKYLLNKHSVKYGSSETSEYALHTNGEILVPTNTQREIRYQIARFCVWGEKIPNHYRYKISSAAIKRAEAQNITILQIKTLIEKYGKKPIPKNISLAIDRWNENQSQVEVKEQILLHVDSAEILDMVQKSPAKQFIVERMNPTTAIISSVNLHRLEDAITKLGFFSDIWHNV